MNNPIQIDMPLRNQENALRYKVSELLELREKIHNLLPQSMAEVTSKDAEYHASEREHWLEKNQLFTLRNQFFHNQVLDEVGSFCTTSSVILELGSGVGYDAGLFVAKEYPFSCYILTEISTELLAYSRERNPSFKERPVVFCAMDACSVPLEAKEIDVVFMIAALHHLPAIKEALLEMDRITKDKASIVFGMEPNRLWLSVMEFFRPLIRRLFKKTRHSAADEEAHGFWMSDFDVIADQTGWKLEKIYPVWFFAGFLHHGLELLFKLFRLKKRIRCPRLIERLILFTDRMFFYLPFSKRLAWHYTTVYVKQK